ncbi:MAG: hypothetical protein IKY56_00685 [Alistipes sp.]|nr:hypothetical protein [Alistipes sp.]MBR5132191.1 hypothetical protein [Alistipes sp.]
MKITKIFTLLAAALLAVGCYEKFNDVEVLPLVDDASFEQMFPDAEHITIAELKSAFGTISNTGVNSGWNNTIYKLIGEDIFVDRDVYIKGKVISSDTEGNIYKSLHIQDETTGIELKLNNSVGLKYKKNTWVYVRLTGLYLGNYRMMLSLGGAPSESYNKAGEHKFYANSNIELQSIIDKHVFAGEKTELKVGTYADWKSNPKSVDIITVTPENYLEVFGTNSVSLQTSDGKSFNMIQRELMFGRLMRFEGLECHYAGVPNQNGETSPALKSGSFDNIYPSWLYSDPRPTVSKGWYQWAFKEEITGRSLYGSVLFTYNPSATVCSANGVYALRTSGYSRFARRNVCKDGEKATITAIYGIYAQKSSYAGNADDYASYQLSISSYSDLEFENGEAALLTDEQVAQLTTEDMKTVPWIDEEGESEYH